MIDQLKDHWPMIMQHPWDALWIFVTGVGIGLGAPAAWRKLFPVSTPKPVEQRTLGKLWASLKKRKFRPSRIEHHCIGGMRYYDNRPLSPDQLARVLHDQFPVSDVHQALKNLEGQGWADWSVDPDTYVAAYTLKGPGLDYAREKQMDVRPRER